MEVLNWIGLKNVFSPLSFWVGGPAEAADGAEPKSRGLERNEMLSFLNFEHVFFMYLSSKALFIL